MDLLDAGCRLGLPDGIDHATVAAGRQDDEPLALEVETDRELVPELIGHHRLGAFVLRQPFRIAPYPALHANLHGGWRQQLLETEQANLARGESMLGDERSSLCIGN